MAPLSNRYTIWPVDVTSFENLGKSTPCFARRYSSGLSISTSSKRVVALLCPPQPFQLLIAISYSFMMPFLFVLALSSCGLFCGPLFSAVEFVRCLVCLWRFYPIVRALCMHDLGTILRPPLPFVLPLSRFRARQLCHLSARAL